MSLEKLMIGDSSGVWKSSSPACTLEKVCVCVVAWFTNSLGLSLKT